MIEERSMVKLVLMLVKVVVVLAEMLSARSAASYVCGAT